ncbi:MAG: hypothetical protein K2X49_13230 [Acetobacteraceae bacterium]|nr:hypothetical protein [Acetobacteraceae bacterium]
MKPAVVDTNVPIVANGRADGPTGSGIPTVECRLAAIDFLESLLKDGRVLLDLAGEIQVEYGRHLRPAGQPGVGDRFFLAVLHSAPQRVERIDLPKAPDGSFADFPVDAELARFDPSDRKFVALSRRAKAPVVVATDSDWVESKAPLTRNGVKIDFLCGCDTKTWFTA